MNVYIICLFSFLLITIFNILTMPKLNRKSTYLTKNELVSVLVPLRDEERNVIGLIQSLKELTYKNVEFILLDDHSMDQTYSKLRVCINNDNRFNIIKGKELPEGWVGKVFACHQLSKMAKGEYMLFLDADVRVKEDTLEKSINLLKTYRSGLLTGFARFPTDVFLAKLLVPMQHFLVYFHLPNIIANRTKLIPFTAAHGGFMFFDKRVYEKIGGHSAVKASLVEDVHLAREVKRIGKKVTLTNISSHVTCFMYSSNIEVWNGFLKNTFSGVGRSVFSIVLMSVFYFIFYVLPLFLAVGGLFFSRSFYILPLILILTQTLIIDLSSRQGVGRFFYMPLAAGAFIFLMFSSMRRGMNSKGYEWKGRMYE
ncbi:glycosyltransferase family 2 protein [Bacillus sp. 31A1R]|uniref:Glycosyltransferase family 2 protein n=1 Tax=Robertmurraya mangrovi TaxID=3098077 RepID=A0ABU5J336_9BACI|nr:glycosyltransferase family 2 protein [Bacillus sp. 31A1R]MDZ5473823.1 glycosyltransferase family 2 protein [Bacillus sp. 31A1R]